MSCHRYLAISISMLFVFLCPWIQAQAPQDIRFEHPIRFDLPLTPAFMQDSDGFLWIGSQNGLIRYDGYEQKIYRTGPNSISNDYIMAVAEDRDGTIWIGSQGGGLDKYDKETNTFTNYQHDPDNPDSLSSNTISVARQALCVDSSGILWVGTQGSGLNRFDKFTGKFTHYKSDPKDPNSLSDNTVFSIIEDAEGVLWIGTEKGGLNKFNKETGMFTHYTHDPDNPQSIGKGWVYQLLQDKNNPDILWIGTVGGGLNKFDKTTEIFTRYSHDPTVIGSKSTDEAIALSEDDAGSLWIGWFRTPLGVSLFDKATETFIQHYRSDPNTPYSLTTDNIQAIYKDRAGIIWLDQLGGAIDTYDPTGQKFKLYQHDPHNPKSLSSNLGVPYYEDREGVIWIGTFDGGLNKYDPETDTFTHYSHDPDNPKTIRHNFVTHIFEDSTRTFWLGTRGGTLSIFDRNAGECTKHYQHDPENPKSIPLHESIRAMIEDRTDPNILWIGSLFGGFAKFDKRTEMFTNYPPNPDDPSSLNNDLVYDLYQDEHEIIWLSTAGGGLNRFDKHTETFRHYMHDPDNSNSISSNQLWEVHEYTPGILWIATVGGGLNRFDKATETFTHYTKETGFPASTILTIRQDDNGNFWMGTDEGLVRFNPETGETKVYKKSDGLQGDVFLDQAALKAQDGQMWFGGINGVNRFDPRKVKDNPYIPPVVVTSFKQGGEEMMLGKAPERVKKIELDWQRNFFEFEFAALNYTKPEKNQYAYMLEGFDRDWYYAGTQRFGRYANLPGGTYTLRVKGSNNDGLWNEHGTSIIINVGSPFWKTWWFYTLCTVAGVGMIGFIYHTQLQARVNRLKAEQQAALHQAAEREKEAANAANKAKSEFLSNMSHELRTPLNAILGYAQILKQDRGLNTQQEKGINIIQQSGEYLLTLINDILDISRIEARKMELYPSDFHLPNFLEGIVGLIRMRAEQKNLTLQYEVPDPLPSGVYADEKRLRQVLLNLLGNAVKFTDQGEVTLHVGVVREPTVEGVYRDASLRITFEISDTGIGIEPEQLEKIFLPFEQVGEVHRRAAGTGLGLPISRQLVELMGSILHVTSRPGEGSTFWFELELPMVEIEATPEHIFERTIVGYEGQRLKALVVDDKPYNRSVLVNLLTPIGFEVAEARDGREGIERARELSPDIIFMDLVMPVMTGIEAVQELRKLPEFRETLIVSVTASVLESDLQQSKLAGCNAFLPKPVKVKQLWAVLETHLRVEWVYEEVSGTEKEEDSAAKAAGNEPLIPPPGEELEVLCELAMLGDLHGLQERADHLEQMDEQFGPFARKLKQLAGTYRDRQVLALIEGYMDIGEHS